MKYLYWAGNFRDELHGQQIYNFVSCVAVEFFVIIIACLYISYDVNSKTYLFCIIGLQNKISLMMEGASKDVNDDRLDMGGFCLLICRNNTYFYCYRLGRYWCIYLIDLCKYLEQTINYIVELADKAYHSLSPRQW